MASLQRSRTTFFWIISPQRRNNLPFTRLLLLLGFLFATILSSANAEEPGIYAKEIEPFLHKHCWECHRDKPAAELQLAAGKPDFSRFAQRQQWQLILERVLAGEMPPRPNQAPAAEETNRFVASIRSEIQTAVLRERAEKGRVPWRRLNRVEYENTLRDLLGISTELKELLPLDSAAEGFDNNAEALHTSSFLLERYLEAADVALNVAIVNRAQPPLVKKRLSLKDERHVKVTTEKVFRQLEEALVCFSSSPWQAITLGQFYPPDAGTYRIRISGYGFQSNDKPVLFRIDAGPMLMGTKNHLVDYFEVPANKPTVIEFTDYFEARNTIRLLPHGLASAQAVNKIGADAYEGPGLAIEWVEVEGPLFEQWPPESHRRIFGERKQQPLPNNRSRLEVVSETPLADAEEILQQFAERAFRRPVTQAELIPFKKLFESRLAEGTTFEQAIRAALKGILVAPEFLFLQEKPGKLTDLALANRLAYFLWSTMPDAELRQIATAEKLRNADALRTQTERLLNHPRAHAFTQNFLGQWLSLRDLDFTEPDRRLYPEFDDQLKAALLQEPRMFFEELLREDLSATNFVAADFTFANERLARHYGLEGIEGRQMRKVKLPADSHRGGVLTMGAVLKVTANGTTTSPVVRGAWVMDRILGTPPRPPPANVSAIEPDIRGASTIREQLAKHREIDSCASCHTKIDPLGFALESFDVIGGWREHYRSIGRGTAVMINGQRMPYSQGLKVDPSDVLADGRKFSNSDELKALLVAQPEQIATAVTKRLITYATGRGPEPSDESTIEAIVKRTAPNYGLRSLVREVVASPLFGEK